MRESEAITERLPLLAAFEEEWEPVAPWTLAAWLVFYGIVLFGAMSGSGLAGWFDLAFVPIHEGGHLLF